MSVRNTLHAALRCPRCGQTAAHEAEVFFGLGNLLDYKLGDVVQWVPRKTPQNGGRPPGGAAVAEGYVECAVCGKDFFVDVVIDSDKIVRVDVRDDKAGYVP